MKVEHLTSSGNVFADLDLADADKLLVKSKLAARLQRSIAEMGLTQTAVAALIGIPQPKLSKILRGGDSRGSARPTSPRVCADWVTTSKFASNRAMRALVRREFWKPPEPSL